MVNKNVIAVAKRRRKLKELVVEYMGGACHRCGWNEHQSGLVPHHVNESKKLFGIGTGGQTRSWKIVKEECKKCILLCANCHAVVHTTNEEYYFNENNIPKYNDLIEKRASKEFPNCLECGKQISTRALHCKSCNGRINGAKHVSKHSALE